jgi:hypothetical protein
MDSPRVYTIRDLPPSAFDMMGLGRAQRAMLDAALFTGGANKWKRVAAIVAAAEGDHVAVRYIVDRVKARCPLRKHKPDPRWESMLVKIAAAAAEAGCAACLRIALREQLEYRAAYVKRFPRYKLIEDKAMELAADLAYEGRFDAFCALLSDISKSRLRTDFVMTDAVFTGSSDACL